MDALREVVAGSGKWAGADTLGKGEADRVRERQGDIYGLGQAENISLSVLF